MRYYINIQQTLSMLWCLKEKRMLSCCEVQVINVLALECITFRHVNGTGRIWVIVFLYSTHEINICSVSISISVGYSLWEYSYILLYLQVSTGTHGYLQNYLKNKYLIINSNKIK